MTWAKAMAWGAGSTSRRRIVRLGLTTLGWNESSWNVITYYKKWLVCKAWLLPGFTCLCRKSIILHMMCEVCCGIPWLTKAWKSRSGVWWQAGMVSHRTYMRKRRFWNEKQWANARMWIIDKAVNKFGHTHMKPAGRRAGDSLVYFVDTVTAVL